MSMHDLRREIEQSCRVGAVLSKKWPKDPDDCWLHRIGLYSFDRPKAGDQGHKIIKIEVAYDITTAPVIFHKTRGWVLKDEETSKSSKKKERQSKYVKKTK